MILSYLKWPPFLKGTYWFSVGCVPLFSSREPEFSFTSNERDSNYSEATVLSGEGGSGGPPFSSGKMDGSNLTQAWQVVHHKGMQDTCMKTEI